ncbi:MAG: hypothetical protein K2H29_04775 [Oscillospiraceae bacterium]|nr:hypothetical protein [Oscillospiraceae bacterium]
MLAYFRNTEDISERDGFSAHRRMMMSRTSQGALPFHEPAEDLEPAT